MLYVFAMKQMLFIIVTIYQICISPFKPYASCRFQPTCSVYAKQMIVQHGAIKGGWLALKRICCCHPWHKSSEHKSSENKPSEHKPSENTPSE